MPALDNSGMIEARRKDEGATWMIDLLLHRLLDSEENERQRLAQVLHDGPLQELHSLDFRMVALARMIEDEQQQMQLTEMRSTLRQLARHLRSICQDLRPPALTPFGVSAVLRSFAEGFQQEQPDLVVELDLQDDGQQLSEQARLTLYRISQHALRNVAQHAHASRVSVSLKLGTEEVELCISDDGRGFVVPDDWMVMIQQGKYGLLNSMERAEAVGGKLQIHSQPGAGTQLRIVAPIVAPTPAIIVQETAAS
jgi:signal transduction histidine kinase